MSGDKSKRNSLNRPKSSSAKDNKDNKDKAQKDSKKGKDKDGDEEMTVVVPPAKSSDADKNGDVAINGTSEENKEATVDPKVQAASGKALDISLLSSD